MPLLTSAEKALVGSIEEGRYFARDRSFSFSLPVQGNEKEVKEMINDALTNGTQIISIHSAAEDTNYRLEVSRVSPADNENSFTQAASKTFNWYRRHIQRAWQLPAVEILTTEFNWNGRPSAHAIYKQFADKNLGPRYHLFYLADFGDKISFFWAHIRLPEENLETEDSIISASTGPALKAKQSFLSFRFE